MRAAMPLRLGQPAACAWMRAVQGLRSRTKHAASCTARAPQARRAVTAPRRRRGQWLAAARRVFEGLEGGSAAPGGRTAGELVAALAAKLPAAEVDWAMEDALLEAGLKDEEELDFMGFLRVLSAGSGDALDQYDPRTASSPNLAGLADASGHGGSGHGGSGHGRLPAVAEEAQR